MPRRMMIVMIFLGCEYGGTELALPEPPRQLAGEGADKIRAAQVYPLHPPHREEEPPGNTDQAPPNEPSHHRPGPLDPAPPDDPPREPGAQLFREEEPPGPADRALPNDPPHQGPGLADPALPQDPPQERGEQPHPADRALPDDSPHEGPGLADPALPDDSPQEHGSQPQQGIEGTIAALALRPKPPQRERGPPGNTDRALLADSPHQGSADPSFLEDPPQKAGQMHSTGDPERLDHRGQHLDSLSGLTQLPRLQDQKAQNSEQADAATRQVHRTRRATRSRLQKDEPGPDRLEMAPAPPLELLRRDKKVAWRHRPTSTRRPSNPRTRSPRPCST